MWDQNRAGGSLLDKTNASHTPTRIYDDVGCSVLLKPHVLSSVSIGESPGNMPHSNWLKIWLEIPTMETPV